MWSAARGANVLDAEDNLFVDLTAGFGAALVGHANPVVVDAVQRQAARLLHALGDLHPSEPKILLEQALCSLAPWPARVLLGLSGSDAVEAALKSCVLATGRAGVLAFDGGYHGLAHGPLAACGYKAAFREPFAGQLGAHVRFAPYPSAEHAERSLEAARRELAAGTIGAVLLEPMLGRGGVVDADPSALAELARCARSYGALLVVDEIYTGLGRTGPGYFDSHRWPFEVDVLCLGKALAGGLPVSACLLREEVARAWGAPGGEALHTSTFLGNPLGSAAALATLEVLQSEAFQRQRDDASAALEGHLREVAAKGLGVCGLGGRGLLRGIHLDGGVERSLHVCRELLERGFLVTLGGVRGDWLVLTPPACITKEQLAHFALALEESLR